MATRIVRSIAGAAAAAAWLTLAPVAQAALYYQSDFDPIDFTMKAIFEVDGCNGSNNWVTNTHNAACSVSMISAVATVNDWNSTHTVLLGTSYITFVDVTNPLSAVSNIIASVFKNGSNQPAGIEWTPFNFTGPQLVSLNPDPNLNGLWGLNIFNFDKLLNSGPPFDSTAFLLKRTCLPFVGCTYVPVDSAVVVSGAGTDPTGLIPLGSVRPTQVDQDGDPIRVAAQVVPEPGSVALLLGALGAGWLARRRKTAV